MKTIIITCIAVTFITAIVTGCSDKPPTSIKQVVSSDQQLPTLKKIYEQLLGQQLAIESDIKFKQFNKVAWADINRENMSINEQLQSLTVDKDLQPLAKALQTATASIRQSYSAYRLYLENDDSVNLDLCQESLKKAMATAKKILATEK
jgi:hypothetical protein